MNRFVPIGAAALAVCACGCAVRLEAPGPDLVVPASRRAPAEEASTEGAPSGEVLAKVGDKLITEGMLDERLKALPPRAMARFGSPAGRKNLVTQMVEMELIAQEAERQGIGEDAETRMRLEEYRRRLMAEKLRQRVLDEVKVEDREIEAEYESQKDRYKTPKQVRVSQILFTWEKGASPKQIEAVEKNATEILDRAKRGEDFAELAKKYSLDQESAPKGGDIGFASRRVLSSAAYDAAMALAAPGDMTGLVKGEQEIRILKATEVVPEKEKSLDELRSWMERIVRNKKQREAWLTYMEGLKKKSAVEIYENKLNAQRKGASPGPKKQSEQ